MNLSEQSAAALPERETLRALNEALMLGSLRQHELAEAADALNVELHEEIVRRERIQALSSFQMGALERLAKGEPVERVLDFIARAMEGQSDDSAVAVHLLEEDGHTFADVAAPSLPSSYAQATRGMDARLQKGPCSAAVTEHKPTVVGDFAGETRWPEFTPGILALGLHGCFTTPIVASDGRILGTLAVYDREPGHHGRYDREWIETGTRMAAIAIERRQAEDTLRDSEERFRTLFELGPVAIYTCDASGIIGDFNRRAAELWGRAPAAGDTDEKFCGSFKLFRADGSFLPHEQCPMAEVVLGAIAEARDAEVIIERPDGSRVVVIVNIRPLTNRHGDVTGAINCFYDITERKEAEQYQRVLMNELAHRDKNLFSVVQAIAVRTLSDAPSLDDARDVLTRRIQALARSQTAFAPGGRGAAPVADIVRREVEGFSARVAASGPDLLLGARRAQTFSLLVHELATNAAKYGALSEKNGTVAIRWSAEGAGDAARFRFRWQERGGPRVVPPTRNGFGRSLLEKVAALDFATAPKLDFAPEGLTYEIDAPLGGLGARG